MNECGSLSICISYFKTRNCLISRNKNLIVNLTNTSENIIIIVVLIMLFARNRLNHFVIKNERLSHKTGCFKLSLVVDSSEQFN